MANILRLGGGGSSILTTPIQVTGLKAVGQDGGVALNIDPATEASYPYLKDYWVVWKKVSDGPIQNPYDGQHMTFAAGGVTQNFLGDLPVGSSLKINYNNANVKCLVLHHGKPSAIYDDSFADTTILCFYSIYEKSQWNNQEINDYSQSTICSELNTTWLMRLNEPLRQQVKQVKVPYRSGTSGAVINSGADGVPCYFYLLSAIEVGFQASSTIPADGALLSYFATNSRIAKYEGVNAKYYLRTPHVNNYNAAGLVNEQGDSAFQLCTIVDGIRPAFCLPSTIQVSLEPDSQGDYTLV